MRVLPILRSCLTGPAGQCGFPPRRASEGQASRLEDGEEVAEIAKLWQKI